MTKQFNTLQELFTDESRWTTKMYARDKEGHPTKWTDDNTVCWCLTASIYLVYQKESEYREIFTKVKNYLNSKGYDTMGIPTWNDTVATFKDIQEMVKELDI